METMRWPYWPFCPLKRPQNNNGGEPQLGACYDAPEGKRIVYLDVNVFGLSNEALKAAKTIEYANSYEVVQDGWEVD